MDADPTPSTPLGEYIRRQRELQKLSMRRLAGLVGISNPYPLHAQSAQAKEADHTAAAVIAAIRADRRLTAAQRQALLEVYRAFTAGAAQGRGTAR
jgi:transcriptional regulator with XRE-family HTH domain